MSKTPDEQQFKSDEVGYKTTLTIMGGRHCFPCIRIHGDPGGGECSLFFDLASLSRAALARRIAKALVHLANRIERGEVALRPPEMRTAYGKAMERKRGRR